MEPALAQFESKFKGKINYVFINVDQKKTPEWKKWGHLDKVTKGEIPYTFWIDSKGKVLEKANEKVKTFERLSAITNKHLKAVR